MTIKQEEYKGVAYTIRTNQVGKRWGWEVSIGDDSFDSGTASIQPEDAAIAEARSKARSVIIGVK
jgi:hypothetical protein